MTTPIDAEKEFDKPNIFYNKSFRESRTGGIISQHNKATHDQQYPK